MEPRDKTIDAMLNLMNETDCDYIESKITTVDGKIITIRIENELFEEKEKTEHGY